METTWDTTSTMEGLPSPPGINPLASAHQLLHRRFEAVAARWPAQIACRWEGQSVTYQTLNRRANQLANRLRTLGVRRESRVAIHLVRSPEMLVAILGVLKAGGAYVPIDPEHPMDRRIFYIKDSGAVVLISQRSLWEETPPPAAATTLFMEDERAESDAASAHLILAGESADDLAYIIYTSGSTGTPKGVMVTHRNVARLFASTQDWFHFGPNDVWSLFHSFAFDFSVWEMWGALLHGGRVVIVPYITSRTPAAMAHLLNEEEVTVLCQTPSAFRQLAPELMGTVPPPLRYVIFGGEALAFRSLRAWFEAVGEAGPRLINMYGITEATVHATYRPVTRSDAFSEGASCIGVPLADLQLHLWDDNADPVPAGSVGELVIEGPGVARGYFERPELTQERFLSRGGRRFYRTGDRARRLVDGDLEYLGRSDGQVKIRGFRIETAEVAARIVEQGDVEQAVVRAVVQDEQMRLVAYCIPRAGKQLVWPALRRFLQQLLPEPMLPSAFVELDRFPLNLNGKIDLAALPVPTIDPAEYKEPETETERRIAAIYCSVLGIQRKLGRDDGFLALGGDSIAAARALAQISERCGATLSFRELFAAQTVADLARVVEARAARGGPPPAGLRQHATSFAEEQILAMARYCQGLPLYSECLLIRSAAPLDLPRLRGALAVLWERHSILRSVFVDDAGQVHRKVSAELQLPVAVHDLRAVAAAERELELSRRATEQVRQGFDLARGPLLRVDVYAVAEDDHRVLLSFHHAILDGWGCAVLLAELAALYDHGSARLPMVKLEVGAAAAMHRQRLPELRQQHLPYWRERLAGLSRLDLPTDHPRPPVRSFRGARIRRHIPGALLLQLRQLASQAGVTVFGTLLGAAFALLHRHTGETDVAIGSFASGRRHQETHEVLGCFINPIVLRQRMEPSLPFVHLLSSVWHTLLDAQEHDELPFSTLVSELGVAHEPSQNPLFQVAISANVPYHSLPPQWSVQTCPFDTGTSRFDLTLQIDERPDSADVYFEYALDLFEPITIERFANRYLTLLAAVARDASTPVGALEVLDAQERATLLRWSDGGAAVHDKLVLERLRWHAQNQPRALAAIYEATQLSYQELDRRSDALASQLSAAGVQPEEIVALCTPPSVEWMVGMIGILKAGAAFLPLDPTQPPARRAAILADAGARILCSSDMEPALPPPPLRHHIHLPLVRAADRSRPLPLLSERSLAYVIYTSGSSGMPKGVLIEHGGLANLSEACIRQIGLTHEDRVAQVAPMNFDACIFEAFTALVAGSTLVVAPPSARLPGQEMLDFLCTHRVSTMLCAPSTLAALPVAQLPHLRTLLCGGDRVSSELVNRWSEGRVMLNAYGPTEATVIATLAHCPRNSGKPPIGRPLAGTRVYVVDERGQPVPIGVAGELCIGGQGVARGYLSRPELSAERFVPDPNGANGHSRMYRTGDLVRFRADGQLDFLSRRDRQVKLHGFRIELGEIEAVLLRQPQVAQAAVVLREDEPGAPRLCAYIVPHRDGCDPHEVRRNLGAELPAFMVPATVMSVPAIPLSSAGKLDPRALPKPRYAQAEKTTLASDLERSLAALWCELLHLPAVGPEDRFFELGGDSLSLSRLQALLHQRLQVDVEITSLLRLPTVRALAAHIGSRPRVGPEGTVQAGPAPSADKAVAIVGMAMRGPGVGSVSELWSILSQDRDTISRFTPVASPGRPLPPHFVAAEGILEDAAAFDGDFFGINAADAALMDPQHRVFMEAAWTALEDAGVDPRRFAGQIGLFAGAGVPRHWLGPVRDALADEETETLSARAELHNAPEFLTSRTAFKLGLRGPAVSVQSACSTSLAAVHLARQALLSGDCDLALAGGVSLASLSTEEYGYVAAPGGILSPDGRCRPFSSAANGTVKASGVALVVLKRLADAERDGDAVRAVLLGSAMNNDGGDKIGFSAPSVEGQVDVLSRAYAAAGIPPSAVSFVQAHGTGTALGDAIEVAALKQVMGAASQPISLTSVKANLGHLDAAAGAAGLIAAVLALQHRAVPGMPGVDSPHPGLSESPFIVHATTRALPPQSHQPPLRAGVSAFGIGGTNVHVVLQEAGRCADHRPALRSTSLLCLSARSVTALDAMVANLQLSLRGATDAEVARAAYTLAVGRAELAQRRAIVLAPGEAIADAFSTPERWLAGAAGTPSIAFLFPGQGAQVANMGCELYREHPGFRADVDAALSLLKQDTGLDLAPYLSKGAPVPHSLLNTSTIAQPATFVISYALAKLLHSWGIVPSALLGHSLGEYAAAAVAGVFGLRDALRLLWERGRLMDSVAPGAMLTVFAERAVVEPHLGPTLSIATEAPGCTVLAGPLPAMTFAEQLCTKMGWEWSRLPLNRAYHSSMMSAIREPFAECVARLTLRPPTFPIVSCITGTWLSPDAATSVRYWADHLCNRVNLTAGYSTLLADPNRVFVDIGPGKSMLGFLRRHPGAAPATPAVAALPQPGAADEPVQLATALGRLFTQGAAIDWSAHYAGQSPRRISLPTYPFQRRRYPIHSRPAEAPSEEAGKRPMKAPAGNLDARPELRAQLNLLCARLVGRFFAQSAGCRAGTNSRISELRARLRLLPKFDRMFEFLLATLQTHGMAEVSAEEVRWRSLPSPDEARDLFLRDHGELAGLLRYIEHCIAAYPRALAGELESIGVLYPDGTDAFYRECMADCPDTSSQSMCLQLARDTAADFVRRRGQRSRLLEVGAGHGTLTWPLIETLSHQDVLYKFTDIGRSFIGRAEVTAARRGLSWFSAGRLDLNLPPEAQGYAPGSFDVVLGFNAVHTARDTAQTLAWLRGLLAPQGMLILVESTRAELWEYLIWGLAPGFWEASGRASGAVLHDAAAWRSLAQGAGFAAVDALPRAFPEQHDHIVLLAQQAIGDRDPCRPEARRAPAREDEEQLERIWKRLLGVDRIDPSASFYALGGDSLLAVQLLAELRVRWGAEVKMAEFAHTPTFAGLLGLLPSTNTKPPAPARSQTPTEPRRLPSCIVPLQPRGELPALFCVHGIGGSAAPFSALASRLGTERPFYGLQATPEQTTESLAALAADYVSAIRAVQPVGPYILSGWSYGAIVAHEMTRQLEERGEVVSNLLLLDAPPGHLPPGSLLAAALALSARRPGPQARAGNARVPLLRRVAHFLEASSMFAEVSQHHLQLQARHQPGLVQAKLTHFRAAQRRWLDWLSHRRADQTPLPSATPPTVHELPGDHVSILEDDQCLGRLADGIRAALLSPEPPSHTGPAEAEVLRVASRFLELSVCGPKGNEAVQALFARDQQVLLFDSYDSNIRGFDGIDSTYELEYQAIENPTLRMYDPFVRISPGAQAACVAALIDATLLLKRSQRPVSFPRTRVTMALEKHDGNWKVVHVHYSIPVGVPLRAMDQPSAARLPSTRFSVGKSS